MAVFSAVTDCENSMLEFSCRTRTLHVTARIELEEDVVCFDDGWTKLLGQSCRESLDAVVTVAVLGVDMEFRLCRVV